MNNPKHRWTFALFVSILVGAKAVIGPIEVVLDWSTTSTSDAVAGTNGSYLREVVLAPVLISARWD